jgi:hypothetical protein
MFRKIILTLFLFSLMFTAAIPAHANCSGAWCEVVNPNGTINENNLKAGNPPIVKQSENWMPTIPFTNTHLEATYKVYYTPSGNKILMPSATTLFYMAMNPSESGYNAAASTLGTGGTGAGVGGATGIAGLGAVFGAMLNKSGSAELMTAISQAGYKGPEGSTQFFQDVLSGKTNVFTIGIGGVTGLLSFFAGQSLNGNDLSLYTYMLLYAPDQCASTPGGCPSDPNGGKGNPTPTSPPSQPIKCPDPVIIPGAISAGGSKTGPENPLVVGQDPNKRGVDLSFFASVAPTIYTYYTQEEDSTCKNGPDPYTGLYNCGGGSGHKVDNGYKCVQHTQTFSECIASASAHIQLTKGSQDWIKNELSILYPGAYVHHPSFSFAGSGCSWSANGSRTQVEDPGIWHLSIGGVTSGTPVMGPRTFGRAGSPFDVYLKETTIIK